MGVSGKTTPSSSLIDGSDSLEFNIVALVTSGQLIPATRHAIEAGVAKGLPITFKRGNAVIKRFPDGREELLEVIDPLTFTIPADVIVIGRK